MDRGSCAHRGRAPANGQAHPLQSAVVGGFTRDDFVVDRQASTVIRPSGSRASSTPSSRHAAAAVAYTKRCTTARGGRSLHLNAYDVELAAARRQPRPPSTSRPIASRARWSSAPSPGLWHAATAGTATAVSSATTHGCPCARRPLNRAVSSSSSGPPRREVGPRGMSRRLSKDTALRPKTPPRRASHSRHRLAAPPRSTPRSNPTSECTSLERVQQSPRCPPAGSAWTRSRHRLALRHACKLNRVLLSLDAGSHRSARGTRPHAATANRRRSAPCRRPWMSASPCPPSRSRRPGMLRKSGSGAGGRCSASSHRSRIRFDGVARVGRTSGRSSPGTPRATPERVRLGRSPSAATRPELRSSSHVAYPRACRRKSSA